MFKHLPALIAFVVGCCDVAVLALDDTASPETCGQLSPLRQQNLVAWCIVPFDAAQRSPAERAAMLKEIGITRCAYDWRQKHVAEFEQEILEYRKHGIEFFAFWAEHPQAFALFEKYDLHPQIWKMFANPGSGTQQQKVRQATDSLRQIAQRTKDMGCKLGLYNHGGWSGDPRNMVAVCKQLREEGFDHVGIVYNFHHGHEHIDHWEESFNLMQPYLHCLNLNGMNEGAQPKILGVGKGAHEQVMIQHVLQRGYDGPVGILDHRTELDARESLLENLEGVRQLQQEFQSAAVPPNSVPKGSGDNSKVSATTMPPSGKSIPYDPSLADTLAAEAIQHGDAVRGAQVFASSKSACVSCHRIGRHGGTVGPQLSALKETRTIRELAESVLWPNRTVASQYVVWQIVTSKGRILSGYRVAANNDFVTLQDPASGKETNIARENIDEEIRGGSPMPAGLTRALSARQQRDLIRFLAEVTAGPGEVSDQLDSALAHAQMHGPVSFPVKAAPVDSSRWAHAGHPVNRDRIYDFYTKQAEHFRTQSSVPMLLSAFPGLDGGTQGHWGNQNEQTWASGRWNDTVLDVAQSGVFHADGINVTRGVCVQLGDSAELATCFNTDTLTYDAVWTGGFVSFSSTRHGFLHGLLMEGQRLPDVDFDRPEGTLRYHGYYRHGKQIVFSYTIDGVHYLDSPSVQDGKLVRTQAPAKEHPLRNVLAGGPTTSREVIETRIVAGKARPFAIDTIELPHDNPWKALMFCGGHDFLPDGSALVCTMQGDVWHVSGLSSGTDQNGVAYWKRFASGLHHPLGLVVADDGVFVQCRDQLTRLTDLNGDGEADFYECFSKAFKTSPAGHDFICGLQRDPEGNFYTASGNEGLVRISRDGQQAEVVATGFRNPDGLGLLPDGTLTVPCSEGTWTPASMICAVPLRSDGDSSTSRVPHFGFRGPVNNQPPALPLAYLPRGLDNSSGGQAVVPKDGWQGLNGQLLHLSFGTGTWFTVLQDKVNGQRQGAVIPMAGDFLSGAHRGRFSPADGQFYVSGMQGWGSYTPEVGAFQRVRYTGDRFQAPVGFHVHENGVSIRFAEPIDRKMASDISSHFAQSWNYRYSGAYGSPEYSTSHPGVPGHDPQKITSAHVLPDGVTLFLEIPALQPVNQLHLRLNVNSSDDLLSCNPTGSGHDLFITVHALDEAFTEFPGYRPVEKTIGAHPILSDMALNAIRVPNPWQKKIEGARVIEVQTGKNLTYTKREVRVQAGEAIAFTLQNPDVVPHNWALIRPGTLRRVGELANQLIADPEAFARHYIPKSEDVLFHTDVVGPGKDQTIYFKAPSEPGRYPYLCTFPGHWMVMNGELIVEAP